MLAFLSFFHMISVNLYSKTIKNYWQVILLRFVFCTLKHSTNVQHKCDASLKFEVQSSSISFMTIFRNTPPRPLFLSCLRASFIAEGSLFNQRTIRFGSTCFFTQGRPYSLTLSFFFQRRNESKIATY